MGVVVVSVHDLPGHPVEAYLGLASGSAAQTLNEVRSGMASFFSKLGGRSGAYAKLVASTSDLAVQDLVGKAESLGATAVLGTQLAVTSSLLGDEILVQVLATGTAVRLA